MNWFKPKKNDASAGTSDRLHTIVRTMEDDLSGRDVFAATQEPSEPLVSFRPGQVSDTPFFAAPGVVEKEKSELPVTEESPFLQSDMTSEPSLEKEEPTFDPPLTVPKAPPIVREPGTLSTVPTRPEFTSVSFNTTHRSALPSFRESLHSLRNLTQGFGPLFQDPKLRFVAFIAGILMIFVVLAGAYFGWRTYFSADQNQPNVRVESPTVESDSLKTESRVQAKYFVEQPNILSFDIETVTAEEIKKTVLQAGQAIKKDNLTGAIEFLIRDQKLNPLAFSRFAYLAKLPLPAELLGTLDEPFSLYITIDEGRPRLSLLMYVKDQPAFTAVLLKNEKKLAQSIEPLFLDVTTASKNNLTFRDSSYLDRPVRFVNIDTTLGLSVDYAVRGRQWIIGTSKGSLRSVLDKTGL